MTQDPVLKTYDPIKDVMRQSDSSQNVLGACLYQDRYLIAHAYRAPTETQRNCAMRDKELEV